MAVERHKQGREKFYWCKFGQELNNSNVKIERKKVKKQSPLKGICDIMTVHLKKNSTS